MDRTDKAGIYIHIPFCRSRCPYCDFHTEVARGCRDDYIDALVDEMKTRRRMREFTGEGKISADTLYFGGGTPSLLTPSQLERLMLTAKEEFSLPENAEITMECNPSSPGLSELLSMAVRLGVNRISLGMQSFSDSERKALGRLGTGRTVEDAVRLVKSLGIDNISLDVMVGVPESSTASLRQSLDFAISMDVPHISAYLLKIEEGTFFHKRADSLLLPSEDEVCDMYLFMSDYLRQKGYLHYEISNFCKDGLYSRHNMKYWEGAPYLGFGAAAHSFFNGKRFYFPRDTFAFTEGKKYISDGTGGDSDEEIMLSLRTYKGISLSHRNEKFISKAKLFVKNGLALIENDRLVLTGEGFLVSNSIISELINLQ